MLSDKKQFKIFNSSEKKRTLGEVKEGMGG